MKSVQTLSVTRLTQGLVLTGLTLSAATAVGAAPPEKTAAPPEKTAAPPEKGGTPALDAAALKIKITDLEAKLATAKTAKNTALVATLERDLAATRVTLEGLAPNTGTKAKGSEKACGVDLKQAPGDGKKCGADGKSCGGAK